MMAPSEKLTQGLHENIESVPNTLYAHADCKETGKVYSYWQASMTDCKKLSLKQQKAYISWAPVCKAESMQRFVA